MPSHIIRDECAADVAAITEVTSAAFADHPYSDRTEHFIIEALRRAGALSVSLVAQRDGRVVGHIAFSPVSVADGSLDWFGLGPMSVLPEFQGCGIGSALVERGVLRLREAGARGCVLVGEPSFYGRFGFAHDPRLFFAGPPPEYFLALSLGSGSPSGEVAYHAAFGAEA